MYKYINWNEVDEKIDLYSMNGQNMICKCVSVIDGDSIKLVGFYHNQLWKFNCRLYGIDTPELHSHNISEKEKAYQAKKFLEDLILNQLLHTEFLQEDKYGRHLVKIKLNDEDISDKMLKNHFAKEYFGGKKQSWN